MQSTYIRAPKLLGMMGEPAWMTLSLNPRRCGTVVAIDGHENWLVHNHLNREDETFELVDRDRSIRDILGVGPDFEYEILTGKTGSAAGWSQTVSAGAVRSFAATPRICGCPMPAMA